MKAHEDQAPTPKVNAAYIQVPMILAQHQWEWLERMTSKHKLSSMFKAVRCCINCVALEGAPIVDHDESTSTTINAEGVARNVELSKEQLAWLEMKRKQNNDGHQEEVAVKVIQLCMEMDEQTVFGIIRCKKSVAKCEGAQEAILNIGQQYNQAENEVVIKENIDILTNKDNCGCDSNNKKYDGYNKTANSNTDTAAASETEKKKKTPYRQIPVTLKQNQWEWLENMTSKHKLPNTSKAVRCCVNCVALDDVKNENNASSAANKSSNSNNDDDGTTKQVELSEEQIAWLSQRGVDYSFSNQIIAACMLMEEHAVFGIIRCKTSIAKCEGAQDAILNIGQQYDRNESEVVVKENIDILTEKDCVCAGK